MVKQNLSEQLDKIVEALVARSDAPTRKMRPSDPKLTPFVGTVAALRDLPRQDFRMRLKSDLERRAMMASKPEMVPEVLEGVIPYLVVSDAAAAIEFYKKAFGASETLRLSGPGPKIGHAEIKIGNSTIMLSDEFVDYGAVSPKTLGGSPAKIHIYVNDVDTVARQAVAAGAKIVRPVQDQFYGDRSGQFADPFGYVWILATQKEKMSGAEMQRRFDAMVNQQSDATATQASAEPRVSPIPKGFRTVTPYLMATDVPQLVDFVQRIFGAEEIMRSTGGSGGGIHSEVRIGNSMLMIGGGGPGLSWKGTPAPSAFHVYVGNVDATYNRAIEAGATAIHEVVDQPYGERGGSVKDMAGNHWYIAFPTYLGDKYTADAVQTVQAYMHPLRAAPVAEFLKRAFGAEESGRYASPDGVIHHTTVRIGDSNLEMGEAHGPYQPMPTTFYLYVPDADALYARALQAGAVSVHPVADQPYGDRSGGVKDPFGNTWYIATHIRDVRS
jgi:PhnB protein